MKEPTQRSTSSNDTNFSPYLQSIQVIQRIVCSLLCVVYFKIIILQMEEDDFYLVSQNRGVFWVPGGAGPLWPSARSAQCQQ